jgi:hypothetical protein
MAAVAPLAAPSGREVRFDAGFILDPDQYYAPSYRISPFATADIHRNLALGPLASSLSPVERWSTQAFCYTRSGKEAIALALRALRLRPSDCVTILTTSGNRYISRCVTVEIEKVCRWSRAIEAGTAAIFVNHEFGYPHRELASLRSHGVPIIEDACHSYLADTDARDMGRIGDFVIFSLPKVFPIQAGGVLVHDRRYDIQSSVAAPSPIGRYLDAVVSHYLPATADMRARRRANHDGLAARLRRFGCAPRFELRDGDVPGVFLFATPPGVDLAAMKEHGWRHGIECSVFYGEDAFFIPVHQRLEAADLDYFAAVFGGFLEGGH